MSCSSRIPSRQSKANICRIRSEVCVCKFVLTMVCGGDIGGIAAILNRNAGVLCMRKVISVGLPTRMGVSCVLWSVRAVNCINKHIHK